MLNVTNILSFTMYFMVSRTNIHVRPVRKEKTRSRSFRNNTFLIEYGSLVFVNTQFGFLSLDVHLVSELQS